MVMTILVISFSVWMACGWVVIVEHVKGRMKPSMTWSQLSTYQFVCVFATIFAVFTFVSTLVIGAILSVHGV